VSPVQALLGQFASVPGVIGSLVCDAEGEVMAQAFPPTFDPARLRSAALALADRTRALETAVGQVGTVDLRYANARIVVKALQGARLLFFCSPSINLELLGLSVSGALRSLERVVGERAAPAAPAGGGRLWEAVQRINVLIERAGGEPFRLRGQIALKAGFSLDLVDADTPDDPAKLQKLKAAASAVLGQPV